MSKVEFTLKNILLLTGIYLPLSFFAVHYIFLIDAGGWELIINAMFMVVLLAFYVLTAINVAIFSVILSYLVTMKQLANLKLLQNIMFQRIAVVFSSLIFSLEIVRMDLSFWHILRMEILVLFVTLVLVFYSNKRSST